MLFDSLRTIHSIVEVIDLSHSPLIDDKCMKSLGGYIKSNNHIEAIWLDGARISDIGIEILAPYLDGNTIFKQLSLGSNIGISDISLPFLVRMVETSNIENVFVDNTSMTHANALDVATIVNKIKSYSYELNLQRRGLHDQDLIKVCESMKKFGIDKLKELNLAENYITSKGASVLFDTLRDCDSVVSILNISFNQLGDECMKHLGEFVQESKHLKKLKLGKSGIADRGVEDFYEYLVGNTILSELDLGWNKEITDVSAPYLIEIAKGSCIALLVFWNASISEESKEELNTLLSIPPNKREIVIKSNAKSAAKISSSASSDMVFKSTASKLQDNKEY